MEKERNPYKAHVLVLPYTAQGHINPMLQFSKRLVSKGVKATLANTKYINKSMHADANSPIDIESISDGFDEGRYRQAGSSEVYVPSFRQVGSQTLAALMKKLDSGRPVDAFIYDGCLPWALDVAKHFGLIGVAFFTQSCAVNNVYYHVHQGLIQGPPQRPTVSVPGVPELQLSEAPSFIGDFGSYPAWYHTAVDQFVNIDQADWVLFNTFYQMEKEVVDWLATKWPLVITVGPTLPSMYLDKRLEDDKDYGMNLLKPDSSTFMSWLANKLSGSVVYVAFGSWADLEPEQMEEVALGLKRRNCYFVWIVRGPEEAKLPKNFKEETSEKGLVVNWCSQLEVLAHESIGCFVTHCGFNSVLEALSLGVPMLAMPQWTDQPTNAKYVVDVWKVGIRVWKDEKGIVRSEAVEQCIKEFMEEGEKRQEIRENARKWKNAAREAVEGGGTSDQNINNFVASLFSSLFPSTLLKEVDLFHLLRLIWTSLVAVYFVIFFKSNYFFW